ncbi:hypothetical protein DFH11DRAFT_1038435 [Phellopilus nigrolimitatus]|nr:hypothetical protein DFH11DRAFT_1038435 [Phellopilus nigrolimitatus]
MSRRDSRVHISVRQNDTLLEFENFKKKFLFANKQITKQNCSLSLKIEELNAHISTLYVENLRLRASEIALQSQLKREKHKCHKIMSDAEGATLNLLKHFGIIRQSYDVSEPPPSPKEPGTPPSLKFQKPPPRSPSAPRLAQLPSVPDITEDPEPHETSSEENDLYLNQQTNFISKRPRISTSRLPVPSRISSPPPSDAVPPINLVAEDGSGSKRKRKLTRRPSGLMPVPDQPTRPVSPALGSPIGDVMDLSEEEEAAALKDLEDIVSREDEREEEAAKKPKKKSKPREDSDRDAVERTERKKVKDDVPIIRLKDVTNSPRRRRRAAPFTDGASNNHERATSSGLSNVGSHAPLSSSSLSTLQSAEDEPSYLPTPLPSSAANTPVAKHASLPVDDGEASAGGRERRTRKSVNYAEPKLNTKMRKPDSIASSGTRLSLTSVTTSAETPLPMPSSSRSGGSARSSPEAEELPMTAKQKASLGAGAGRRSTLSTSVTKRKRLSKSQSDDRTDGLDDGETDGGDADAEFSEFSDFKSGLANINTRRKSVQSDSDHDVTAKNGYHRTQREIEDGIGRRHSIAI